jgi:hypothetical protein
VKGRRGILLFRQFDLALAEKVHVVDFEKHSEGARDPST